MRLKLSTVSVWLRLRPDQTSDQISDRSSDHLCLHGRIFIRLLQQIHFHRKVSSVEFYQQHKHRNRRTEQTWSDASSSRDVVNSASSQAASSEAKHRSSRINHAVCERLSDRDYLVTSKLQWQLRADLDAVHSSRSTRWHNDTAETKEGADTKRQRDKERDSEASPHLGDGSRSGSSRLRPSHTLFHYRRRSEPHREDLRKQDSHSLLRNLLPPGTAQSKNRTKGLV